MNVEEKNSTKEELTDALKTVLKLRYVESELTTNSAPSDVLNELLGVRKRLDQIERLYIRTSIKRRELLDSHAAAKADAEAAGDEHIVSNIQYIAAHGNDYSTGDERKAKVRAKIFKELREERFAEELANAANSAYYDIRTAYQGLDGYRQDLLAWLKNTQFESSLER